MPDVRCWRSTAPGPSQKPVYPLAADLTLRGEARAALRATATRSDHAAAIRLAGAIWPLLGWRGCYEEQVTAARLGGAGPPTASCRTGRYTTHHRVNGGASPGPPRRAAARDRRAPARPSAISAAAHCPTSHSHALGKDPAGQEITAAWIGKEKLRDALNLRARVTGSAPCERDVRGRLFAFYDWCARNDDIPELLSLARTVSRWENEIVAAVLTGITNSVSESLNRLAKLEGRLAYGFRNPVIQRRRVNTRGTRRRSRHVTIKKSRSVTGRRHDPGY
jgi:hypothetical protein